MFLTGRKLTLGLGDQHMEARGLQATGKCRSSR